MTLQNIFMYYYNLLWSHNCGYLYSEERTTGGFLRMATNKPPCVIISYYSIIMHLSPIALLPSSQHHHHHLIHPYPSPADFDSVASVFTILASFNIAAPIPIFRYTHSQIGCITFSLLRCFRWFDNLEPKFLRKESSSKSTRFSFQCVTSVSRWYPS